MGWGGGGFVRGLSHQNLLQDAQVLPRPPKGALPLIKVSLWVWHPGSSAEKLLGMMILHPCSPPA